MKTRRFLFIAAMLCVAMLAVPAFAESPTNAVDIASATTYYNNGGVAILGALFAVMLGFVGLRWIGKLGGRK